MTIEEAQNHLKVMDERGRMYVYLESVLGQGISLVLGTDFAETTWTGLLTKGSQRPDPIMEMLKRSSVILQANRYARLRQSIVRHKMLEVINYATTMVHERTMDNIYLTSPIVPDFSLADTHFP